MKSIEEIADGQDWECADCGSELEPDDGGDVGAYSPHLADPDGEKVYCRACVRRINWMIPHD